MLQQIQAGLKARYDVVLVDELLSAHQDAKENFSLGGLRLSAVEGGRFCEAAFRMLQSDTQNSFTPLGSQLDTERLIVQLAALPRTTASDSIRLHIPRALRVVYDIRNKRDAAHLADGIDPNLQDATLVVAILDWVLAEFVRLHHGVSANEAQSIVENLVTRSVPAVEDFNGFLKVLRADLKVSERVMLVLYECGPRGADYESVASWMHPSMRANLKRALNKLVHDDAFLHFHEGRYFLTKRGRTEVEARNLHRETT